MECGVDLHCGWKLQSHSSGVEHLVHHESRCQFFGVHLQWQVLRLQPHPLTWSIIGRRSPVSIRLPITHVIITLSGQQPAGKKCTWMKFSILGGTLRQNRPHPGIRCIHLHNKLQCGIRLSQNRCRRESTLEIVKGPSGFLRLWTDLKV